MKVFQEWRSSTINISPCTCIIKLHWQFKLFHEFCIFHFIFYIARYSMQFLFNSTPASLQPVLIVAKGKINSFSKTGHLPVQQFLFMFGLSMWISLRIVEEVRRELSPSCCWRHSIPYSRPNWLERRVSQNFVWNNVIANEVKQRLSKSFRSKRTTNEKFIMLVLHFFGVGSLCIFQYAQRLMHYVVSLMVKVRHAASRKDW